MKQAHHFVYIIKNPDGIYYKGYSTNVVRRLAEHNSSEGKYTSLKGPWKLVYQKELDNKRDALIEERRLKRLNHKSIEKLINKN